MIARTAVVAAPIGRYQLLVTPQTLADTYSINPPGHVEVSPAGRGPNDVYWQRASQSQSTATSAATYAHGPLSVPVGPPAPGRSHLDQIFEQISSVLDPLAVRCRGWPPEQVRPILAATWRREFHCTLRDPGLADAAAAISDGRPWTHALWTDGW